MLREYYSQWHESIGLNKEVYNFFGSYDTSDVRDKRCTVNIHIEIFTFDEKTKYCMTF